MSPNPSTTAPRMGKYDVVAKLGQGGMAEVFLACARGPAGFNKLVVVKRLRSNLEDPKYVEMFLEEARLAARLNHPNIVQTNEVVEEGGEYFMIMEYLDGQSLISILHRANLADPHVRKMMLFVVSQALLGLHAAHTLHDFDGTPLGVIHRDVSPHNLFVTYDGQVKVVDFGIAKIAQPREETAMGVLKGKLHYMAPEQINRSGHDHRGDVFSAGILLYEIAARRRFWGGRDFGSAGAEIGILTALLENDFDPSPRAHEPAVDAELDAICRRALAYEKAERYPTARDLHADLQRYLATSGPVPTADELGRFVSDLFASERAQLRATIEGQLTRLAATNGSSPPLPISVPQLTATSDPASSVTQGLPLDDGSTKPRRRVALVVGAAVVAVGLLGAVVGLRSTRTPPATGPAASIAASAESQRGPIDLGASAVTASAPAASPSPVVSAAPTPTQTSSSVPSKPIATPARPRDCAVPFTIDSAGIKHPKPACH